MDALLAMLVGVILACGAHLLLSRDLFRVVLGAMLLTSSANLAVIVLGRTDHRAPAFVPAGVEHLAAEQVANPLPQAFVLTAIVIGLALFSFVLALLVPVARRREALGVDRMPAADPGPERPDRQGPP